MKCRHLRLLLPLALVILCASCDSVGRIALRGGPDLAGGIALDGNDPVDVIPLDLADDVPGDVDVRDSSEVDIDYDLRDADLYDSDSDVAVDVLPWDATDLLDTFDIDDIDEDGPFPDIQWDLDIEDSNNCQCTEDSQCATMELAPCGHIECVFDDPWCGKCEVIPDLVCESSNSCVVSQCLPGQGCVSLPMEPGSPCDDGNLCTQDDHCVGGECISDAVVCPSPGPCSLGVCDPETGKCASIHYPFPCDDGDACTEGDICHAGSCQAGALVNCDDGDLCTIDSCNPLTGCETLAAPGCCHMDTDCQNGDLCTTGYCVGNQCQYQAVVCNDGDFCTQDSCFPASGCQFDFIEGCCHTVADCDDSSVCTVESCNEFQCQYKQIACADSNPCTADSCDPSDGCNFEPIGGCCLTLADCNDYNVCTVDSCQGNECSHALVSCDDGDACTVDSCNPVTGCQSTPTTNPDCCNHDVECNDLDPCTDDVCLANLCVHSFVVGPGCCEPTCVGKECGPDGCGNECGECIDGYCGEDFQCHTICIPDCNGKECGPDGCGTYCGLCTGNQVCNPLGTCVNCLQSCGGKECGPDGCGGSCGFCNEGESCSSATGLCVPACACSGPSCYRDGFEGGNLSGWSFEGDVEVNHNMGTTEAVEGWYMAVLGTGLSDLELGKIQKTFCPPANVEWFTVQWRFFSEEFEEWCGSMYQDAFSVTVSNPYQSFEVVYRTVDMLCRPDSCQQCGNYFVGLEPADVTFDQGDVYMTPWQTAQLQLPPGFANTPVTVTIQVYDVGDMQYTSVVLVDNIFFFTLNGGTPPAPLP